MRAGRSTTRGRPAVPGAQDLALFYLWVVVVSSTAFILLVGVVAWSGWHQQRQEQTDLAATRVRESAVRLDARIKDVREEVQQLHRWAVDLPRRPGRGAPLPPPSPRRADARGIAVGLRRQAAA